MKLAAVVLAAGSARRFGGAKLSADFMGEPLLAHALRAARSAPVERVVVVCAIDAVDVPPPAETLHVDSNSLSGSLKSGIAAVAGCDGAFVFLGDMPLVPHDMARQLAAALGTRYAAVPECAGMRGHPVLLSRQAFADIAELSGDCGAGALLRGRADIATVPTTDQGVLLDIDTPADLVRVLARANGDQDLYKPSSRSP